MDLGSAICTTKVPCCESCPLKKSCISYRNGKFEFALKKRRKTIPQKYGHVFLVERADGSYLLDKRGDSGLLAKTYQFPTTEWREEKIISKYPKKDKNMSILGKVKHKFSHFSLELTVIRVCDDSINLSDVSVTKNAIWKKPDQLNQLGLSSLMRKASKYI